ncbi:MAG: hypothetical protein R3222_04260 [Balneolaceae bacterium]|nr:hypothetical protein [Balneolaceae bacterium]
MHSTKRFYHQLIIIILLIIFPLVMIYYNGKRTIDGITWGAQFDTSVEGQGPVNSVDLDTETSKIDRPQKLLFGVYDPDDVFQSQEVFEIEQLYISWVSYDKTQLIKDLNAIISDGDSPLITIEPWPRKESERNLMKDIANGNYDDIIGDLCSVIENVQTRMYLSWGHEMDQDLTERYPWSDVSPHNFVDAYHYVVDKLNNCSESVEWIWNPVAKEGSQKYWPGNEYVDYIGLPVYSFPQWDNQFYNYTRSFTQTFGEKYDLVSDYGKPILITEFGVTGSTDFQVYWLQQAFTSFVDYPLLRGVIFFHARDTEGAWGNQLPTPDWRTDTTTILSLVEWYQRESLPVEN